MSTPLKLTFQQREMAGGTTPDSANALGKYRELALKSLSYEKFKGADKANNIWTMVILSLLIVFSAGIASSLIAISGGPSNLAQFGTGTGFGVVTVGLSLWLIIEIVNATKSFYRIQTEELDCLNKEVSKEEVLEAMEKEKSRKEDGKEPTDPADHIYNALSHMGERLTPYMEWVYGEYFADGKPALTPGQARIISVFARFPVDLAKMQNLNQAKPEFAYRILKDLDPAVANKAFTDILLERAGVPATPEQNKIFARYPEAVAELALATAFEAGQAGVAADGAVAQTAAAIYAEMTTKQRVIFLQKIAAEKMAAGDDAAGVARIHLIVASCLAPTLTRDFVQFSRADRDAEEKAQQKLLLTEMGKWPTIIAPYILSGELDKKSEFLNQLKDVTQPEDFREFINTGVQILDCNFENSKGLMRTWLNAYEETGTPVPLAVGWVFALLPHFMASLEPEFRGKVSFETIARRMPQEQKGCYRDLVDLHQLAPEAFAKEMAKRLLDIHGDGRGKYLENVLHYFRIYPESFKHALLKNEDGLGDKSKRAGMAISILVAMGPDAVPIIEDMDSDADTTYNVLGYQLAKGGYPYFNLLTNLLVNEANRTRGKVGESLGRLMAYFAQSPKMKDNKDGSSLNSEWNLKKPGAEWKHFHTVVANYTGSTSS